MGEEFDRNPFLLFTLRGMTQEELRTRLTGTATSELAAAHTLPAEPLEADTSTFWNGRSLDEAALDAVQPPPVSAPLLRRLGSFPFWRGDVPLLEICKSCLLRRVGGGAEGISRGESFVAKRRLMAAGRFTLGAK